MKVLGVLPNINRDRSLEETKKLIKVARDIGFEVIVKELMAEKINMPELKTKNIYKEADALIVLGGDGTMLRASKQAAFYDLPILGINFGHLGYLTDVEKKYAKEALEKLARKEYILEKRMMLEMHKYIKNVRHSKYLALNDVFVSKDIPSKMVELRLDINDEFFAMYRADGVIISTPTGSTAYNLSAGGSILKPDSEMFGVTSVCPHDLHSRACVLPSSDTITIEIAPNNHSPVVVACDGDMIGSLADNEKLLIQKSSLYTTIIRTNYMGFYDRLRLKLGDSPRGEIDEIK